MSEFKISSHDPVQIPITLIEFIGNLANGATQRAECPCIGHVMCMGQIYSSQAVTCNINQGVDDSSGPPLAYDRQDSTPVAAGTTEPIEVPITGKYIECEIINASGFPATIRAFFTIRPYE